MKKEVILSGFGGQGVMSIGKNLVEAAVAEELEASWVPSYGPEMRGGTANCTVIISDERIGAPLVENPTEVVAMNRAALAKFEKRVAPGGTVFVNSSIIPDKVAREDVTAVYVPCDEIAAELGNAKVANMVMLGAYVLNEKKKRGGFFFCAAWAFCAATSSSVILIGGSITKMASSLNSRILRYL